MNKTVSKIEPRGTLWTIFLSKDVYLYCVEFLVPFGLFQQNEWLDKTTNSCFL